jgi:transposase
LRRLVVHRAQLKRESTRRKNKLTAICDQLFPEFTEVFKDPNGETALAFRAAFPTPHALATAMLGELVAVRKSVQSNNPSAANLARLQELAVQTIGLRDVVSQGALAFEQGVLIEELLMQQRNIARLEAQIDAVVASSREGQILTSIPGIGTHIAAVLMAAIGNVRNFPTDGDLKAFLGWSTQQIQTGTTVDRTRLSPMGTRATRSLLYLAVCKATTEDCQSARLYHPPGAQKVQLRRAQGPVCGQKQGHRHRRRAHDQPDLHAAQVRRGAAGQCAA